MGHDTSGYMLRHYSSCHLHSLSYHSPQFLLSRTKYKIKCYNFRIQMLAPASSSSPRFIPWRRYLSPTHTAKCVYRSHSVIPSHPRHPQSWRSRSVIDAHRVDAGGALWPIHGIPVGLNQS
ncbi:hypothetical protein BD779DRAFT_1571487 [Infundibulicybe gibba]|nr:hypothetical protein BD779DRAFT_1571487 [Infundibulicybe gibba]